MHQLLRECDSSRSKVKHILVNCDQTISEALQSWQPPSCAATQLIESRFSADIIARKCSTNIPCATLTM